MKTTTTLFFAAALGALCWRGTPALEADESGSLPAATINGTGLGWRELGEDDFVMVNGDEDTWTWKDGGVHCKGTPVGVTRTKTRDSERSSHADSSQVRGTERAATPVNKATHGMPAQP